MFACLDDKWVTLMGETLFQVELNFTFKKCPFRGREINDTASTASTGSLPIHVRYFFAKFVDVFNFTDGMLIAVNKTSA